ncbi:hypothetical protein C2S52_007025 [Perilla frutescens var. hirtella]|nr:hypothetical protein C2S51_008829 [Perilla frutescens var. frutescens]KAH6787473.1 hypothetical protein C2S52_007025 [Perilla frutescens var. hirtella]
MRSIEDKGCWNNCPTEEKTGGSGSCMIFELKKSGVMSRPSPHHRSSLGKPAPSKWDDAQKWLVNLSRGEKAPSKASPRNSNADDRRLIVAAPKDYDENDEETKNVECDDESVWRGSNKSGVRAICLRDMGTEMTPIASKEPSRAPTPIRVISPASSGSSSPAPAPAVHKTTPRTEESASTSHLSLEGQETNGVNADQSRKLNPLEDRAAAWEQAERAKYMARYKRQDAKIEAWENHEKRKAELENRKVEAKVERLKSRAKDKCSSRIAATRRIGEEKRVAAESKLNDKAIKTSQRADYIRTRGHLPFSFSFKLPSCCCCHHNFTSF